jgi:caffeoyl-CoA O-methyltransferase
MRYEQVADYVERFVKEKDASLALAYKKSIALRPYGVIPIDPARGRFLELVAKMTNPKRVLEIGPGGGYSGLWFLKGMKSNAKLEVVEHHLHVAAEFRRIMKMAGFAGRVSVHLGQALEVLPRLRGYFDVVFIDANKDEYPSYLKHSMRLTHVNSVILADNLLWGGSVLDGTDRIGVRGISEFTKMIFKDRRLKSLIVPLGDGLSISFRVA